MSEYIEREMAKLRIFEYGVKHRDNANIASACENLERQINSIPAADVRSVVTCSDCKWWTKQESSLQGRCELLQMYPTGAWFCANGKREES